MQFIEKNQCFVVFILFLNTIVKEIEKYLNPKITVNPTSPKKISPIFLLLLLLSLKSFSQSNDLINSINTTGNDLSGNSGSISYSIGQVFFSQIEDNNYQITKGIQHGIKNDNEENTNNEDSDVPDDIMETDVKAIVHPNPTTDYVTLTTEGFDFTNQLNSYHLYNYQGKLLHKSTILNQNSTIDLTNLSTSIYILQVFAKEKLLKTFKIIKN